MQMYKKKSKYLNDLMGIDMDGKTDFLLPEFFSSPLRLCLCPFVFFLFPCGYIDFILLHPCLDFIRLYLICSFPRLLNIVILIPVDLRLPLFSGFLCPAHCRQLFHLAI